MDKLYICVLDEVPDYIVPTLVGHAVLIHHLESCLNRRYVNWLNDSFRKCVVRVNRKEFSKILELKDVSKTSESRTLNGEVSCLTVIANTKEHNVLRFAKLWKPLEG